MNYKKRSQKKVKYL